MGDSAAEARNARRESEPSAIWIDQHFGPESPYAHLGIQVYDLKGLTYLDDIPDFCKFLDGTPVRAGHSFLSCLMFCPCRDPPCEHGGV